MLEAWHVARLGPHQEVRSSHIVCRVHLLMSVELTYYDEITYYCVYISLIIQMCMLEVVNGPRFLSLWLGPRVWHM